MFATILDRVERLGYIPIHLIASRASEASRGSEPAAAACKISRAALAAGSIWPSAQAGHDYEVNLKAELEILALQKKIDWLREHQWVELVAMQQKQIQLLTKLLEQRK